MWKVLQKRLCFRLYKKLTNLNIHPTSDDVLTWRESDLACKSFDAELVSMETTIDQDFVEQLLIQNSKFNSSWIGLNSLRIPNQYEWSDGSYVSNGLKMFAS